MINPAAYFDSLSIVLRLQKRLGEPSTAEISLFSYLSCLLWLYKKNPVSTWGYDFALTPRTYPFSADLQNSIMTLRANGFIRLSDEFYIHITPQGEQEYQQLKEFSTMAEREPFLEGACSSLLALPYGVIRNTLQQEPDVRATMELSQSRALLTENDMDSLYEQFNALSAAIGIDMNDLMIPAVVWLKYLAKVQLLQEQ